MSQLQKVATQAPPDAKFPKSIAFLQFWKWLLPAIRNAFHENAPYQTYPGNMTGIFPIAAPAGDRSLRIAVAADWGCGTLESQLVAENIASSNPHLTVHLGDVYYMGEAAEVEENCLGQPTNKYEGVRWPAGSLGSFALMGNHEMYSGGQGYFNQFLTTLGILNPDRTVHTPQSASYFCLETDHWLMLGLDTGYHSGGVPLFTSIPLLNKIPFFNVDARFDNAMMAWLSKTITVLQAQSPCKPIVLLTHHQPVSSFEHFFTKPALQLAQFDFFRNRGLVWLYGHEHRLTVYKEQTIAGSVNVHPRCIGHGGIPVEISKPKLPDANILYYDPRKHPIDNSDPNTKVGYNGHVVLLFQDSKLTIEYRDITNNDLLLSETFTPDQAGRIQYVPSQPAGSPLCSG